ncbi:hypothetical protein AVEN_101491-1 [Araneus ventricosus]|uniref:Uncharacterized protein n=1 Tax=Araneus ventricosus TaxID=182803 RepID=A0A4Y2FD29_ARAVE|nr:hypothetical protein AVEN_101491-1 [Araneus ventricosus]
MEQAGRRSVWAVALMRLCGGEMARGKKFPTSQASPQFQEKRGGGADQCLCPLPVAFDFKGNTSSPQNKRVAKHGAEVKRVILTLRQRSPTQEELVTAHESCETHSLIGEMFASGEREPFAFGF